MERNYRNKEWLTEKLKEEKGLVSEVARICGVTKETIKKWADKFGIERGHVWQRYLQSVGLATTCPKCGEITPNGNYCSFCGAKLN